MAIKPTTTLAFIVCLCASLRCIYPGDASQGGKKQNKFREREATDDSLHHPNIDEDELQNSHCPQKLELRWQAEVSSSIYATPLIADINSDGKAEVVVPSFVHYLEVLEGADGDKVPGWPAYHQSAVHSSPLLYDIDKDGVREIVLPTYNGEVLFFRVSGYLMPDKLEVPRRRIRKDWFVGLHPDPVDRSRPDVHDDTLIQEASDQKLRFDQQQPVGTENGSVLNGSENVAGLRRLLVDADNVRVSSVENDVRLGDEADASFDLFRDDDDGGGDLPEDYSYDDYGMWGNEEWVEPQHAESGDFVNVDSHILCTPVIADIDNDGVSEMVIAVSYFFDRDYYDNPEHMKELGDIEIEKYVGGSIVVFDMDTKQVKWTAPLDLSTDNTKFRGYIYSSPTVYDLDGDGNLDVLVGTSFGLFYVLDHFGRVREKFPLEMAEIHAPVVAADINDDGRVELITADVHGNVAAWTPQGDEIWETHLRSLIPQGPSVGDVNGDGLMEVVLATQSGNVYVLSGKDGSVVGPYPYATHGRIMSQVLLVGLGGPGLTMVVPSFNGYLYLIDGVTSCADVVDIGETSYSMVLADNVDGGDRLDLIVATMNGNVFCFSTPAPHHPLKSWRSPTQGRNNVASRHDRRGVFIGHSSRGFRDEAGKSFWIGIEIVDKYRVPSGFQPPYNITVTLLVPGNYQGERRISKRVALKEVGKHRIEIPTVAVRTVGTVLVEMVDRNGVYFTDEFSLTFHMHYYKLLKWLVAFPALFMLALLLLLHPRDAAPLPSFSRNTDL